MILVTGASGFLGGAICAAADRPFRALVRRPDAALAQRYPLAEFVKADLCDVESLRAALRGVHTVFHLATKTADHDGSGFIETNINGLERLLSVAPGGMRVVVFSSTGVYGHHRHAGAGEETPLSADTPYSRSRARADELVVHAHREGRVNATILRHRFVYGDGDTHVVPGILRAVRRTPFWVGGGRARFSMVWAADLARVAWQIALEPEPRDQDPIYHLVGPEPVRFRDLAADLCQRFGGQPPRLSVPFPLLHGALRLREAVRGIDPETASGTTSLRVALFGQDNWFSGERLASRLPSFRFTPLSEGLAASAAWYDAVLRDA